MTSASYCQETSLKDNGHSNYIAKRDAFNVNDKPSKFEFVAFLVFKLFIRKEFVYQQKGQWKVLRSRIFFRKITISRVYNYNIANTLNMKFSGYTIITSPIIY